MKKIKIISFFNVILLLSVFGCTKDNPVSVISDDPVFNYISSDWIAKYYKMDMRNVWLSDNIDREGSNYYFLPKPSAPNKCSERFDPNSKYFQSWFGIYTISDNSEGVYGIKSNVLNAIDIIRLGISDQKAWLRNFAGLDTPIVYLDTAKKISVENVIIDNTEGWKISGRMISNVDVGDNNAQNLQEVIKIDKSLWEDVIKSYQQVGLDIELYVWYSPSNKELNVAYFNGVDFIDKNSVMHKTLNSIEPELQKMVNKITVQK